MKSYSSTRRVTVADREGAAVPTAQALSAMVIVTSLFFVWGFLTCLNDILVPHLKAVFSLNYATASLVQFVFFGAYFLMSLPAGKIVGWLGYQQSMVVGLSTAAAGTLLFYPAASFASYPIFLEALFVLASGITLLQIAANPFVSSLGKPETASSRLNLTQAFNSLGTTVAPSFGGWLILAGGVEAGTAITDRVTRAASIKVPYLIITGVLLLMAWLLRKFPLPKLAAIEGDQKRHGSFIEVLCVPNLLLGCIGIFLYVGAEVAIGSYLINFMGEPTVARLSPKIAAGYVSYYWGGAMLGRFLGSFLLRRVDAAWLLRFNALFAASLCILAYASHGAVAMWAILLVGLFNSIMFPNIFTLSIQGLGHLTSYGSSLLIMAIVGGAIVPVLMGRVADAIGLHQSFFIPAISYLYIAYYGFHSLKAKRA
ncbi:MAG: sugar MFS transporter [Candidatus Xiphinematobacter sp.]|nr:MAG: sugar MFS transporter [Candidatus Xiphinematobacter sp.]